MFEELLDAIVNYVESAIDSKAPNAHIGDSLACSRDREVLTDKLHQVGFEMKKQGQKIAELEKTIDRMLER